MFSEVVRPASQESARAHHNRTIKYLATHRVVTDLLLSKREGPVRKGITIRRRVLQSQDAIDLLSNKWRITVLSVLRQGPLRTREIQGAMR